MPGAKTADFLFVRALKTPIAPYSYCDIDFYDTQDDFFRRHLHFWTISILCVSFVCRFVIRWSTERFEMYSWSAKNIHNFLNITIFGADKL